MRFVLALILILMSTPSWGNMIVVSDGAGPVVPNIDSYLASESIDETTIRAGIAAATTAGDTVYVHSITTTEQVDENDWAADDVVLICNSDYSQVVWSNSSAGTGLIEPSSAQTGTKIVGFQMVGVGGGLLMSLEDGVEDLIVESCRFVGAPGVSVYFEVGATITNVSFTDCYIAPLTMNTLAVVWSRSFVDDVTWTNCEFDLSGISVTGNEQGFQIVGAHGWLFDNCSFKTPVNTGTGHLDAFSIEGSVGYTQGDIEFLNCDFTSAAPTSTGAVVTLTFGRSSGLASSFVDSVLIQGCIFTGPGSDLVSAIKFENPSTSGWHEAGAVIGNTLTGYHISIGFLEGALGLIASGNNITGINSGNDSGIYFQDARRCVASYNIIKNCDRGLQWDDGSNSYENYGNSSFGNIIDDCEWANRATTGNDSASVRMGNFYGGGNTSIGTLDGEVTNLSTIELWQAASVVDLPPGAFNGQGDTLVFPGAIDGFLRANGILPWRRGYGGGGGYN